MKTASVIGIGLLALGATFAIVLYFQAGSFSTVGWLASGKALPTHSPRSGCSWVLRTFEKASISFYQQHCRDGEPVSFEEDENGAIIASSRYGGTYRAISIYDKTSDENPKDVIQNKWFSKLTEQQKSLCSIQDADYPSNDYSNYGIEDARPTPHKTRYKIDIKPEIMEKMIADSGGDLPMGSQYDYICGTVVGSPLEARPPYFEFDDRNSSKYLFLSSFGNAEGPPIDLNSIHF